MKLLDPLTGRMVDTMSPLEMVSLSMEVAPLADLVEFEPVGSALETLGNAMRGIEGVSARDVEKMRRWARRWSHVSAPVREFYRTVAGRAEVAPAIWYLLTVAYLPEPATRAIVRRLYTETTGHEPVMDLFPRMKE